MTIVMFFIDNPHRFNLVRKIPLTPNKVYANHIYHGGGEFGDSVAVPVCFSIVREVRPVR